MARVWEEAEIAVRRQNVMLTSGVTLLQVAVSGLFSKDARKDLNDIIKGLTDG